MASKQPVAAPAVDEIPRVDDAVSVGEDLDFQRAWWKFEKAAWIVLALVLLADALGLFGRGWLANAKAENADGSLRLKYERIERADTSSVMEMTFGENAVHNGQVRVFCNDTVVKELGAQRIIPQPATSELGPQGITYTFDSTGAPAEVSIAMQPSKPGIHHVMLRVPGEQPVNVSILVLP